MVKINIDKLINKNENWIYQEVTKSGLSKSFSNIEKLILENSGSLEVKQIKSIKKKMNTVYKDYQSENKIQKYDGGVTKVKKAFKSIFNVEEKKIKKAFHSLNETLILREKLAKEVESIKKSNDADIVLKLKGSFSIPFNKELLINSSTFFENLFASSEKGETDELNREILEMDEVYGMEPEIVIPVIHYLQKNNLKISKSFLLQLIKGVDMLGVSFPMIEKLSLSQLIDIQVNHPNLAAGLDELKQEIIKQTEVELLNNNIINLTKKERKYLFNLHYEFINDKNLSIKATAKAEANLGAFFLEGLGTQKDDKRGVELLRISASKKDPFGLFLLAKRFFSFNSNVKPNPRAIRDLEMAAEQGFPAAQSLLGKYYYYTASKSEPEGWRRGFDLIQLACTQGERNALLFMGFRYAQGNAAFGIEKDKQQAAEFFKKSAEAGNLAACIEFANCLYQGEGVNKNVNEALEYYQLVKKSGSYSQRNEAKVKMQLIEWSFLKPEEQYEKALYRLRKKFISNYIPFVDEFVYDMSDVRKRLNAEAFELLELAAARDHKKSLIKLAQMYDKGITVQYKYEDKSRRIYDLKKADELRARANQL